MVIDINNRPATSIGNESYGSCMASAKRESIVVVWGQSTPSGSQGYMSRSLVVGQVSGFFVSGIFSGYLNFEVKFYILCCRLTHNSRTILHFDVNLAAKKPELYDVVALWTALTNSFFAHAFMVTQVLVENILGDEAMQRCSILNIFVILRPIYPKFKHTHSPLSPVERYRKKSLKGHWRIIYTC